MSPGQDFEDLFFPENLGFSSPWPVARVSCAYCVLYKNIGDGAGGGGKRRKKAVWVGTTGSWLCKSII